MKQRFAISVLLLAFFAIPLHAADPLDYSLYDDLLRSYVNPEGLVNYEGLRTNSVKDLQDFLDQLASAHLKYCVYEEKLAFWINAYNAIVIKQILDHPEIERINEHLEIFDVPFKVAGGKYSLNDIEHRIILGKINKTKHGGPPQGGGPIRKVTLEFFDPRVHLALVCGAIDCPKLRNFAYTSHNVEATLSENSIAFANSPKYLRIEDGRLRISSLMKWYADDFQSVGGAATFFSHLIDPALRKDAGAIKKLLATEYDKADFEYDWTVNDVLYASTQNPDLQKAPK